MAQTPRTLTPYTTPRHFFGAELRGWRERRGLSQARLARQVHVSADLICKVEKAERKPTADLVQRCDHVLRAASALTRLFDFVQEHGGGSSTQSASPMIHAVTVVLLGESPALRTLDAPMESLPSNVARLDEARRTHRRSSYQVG